ncbi:phosphoribosylglycinamide formyltransferase [Pendulispora albinea]|uniref:Phosphoribosylglycinamide formyltransferase n=1 Tax=Pendulispora albinea TaxID=2741071 RepID=A0ABZ2MCL4_9BACT
MVKLGVLISGTGSNLKAVLDAIDQGRLAAEVAVVISNVPSAKGLEHARARGIPALVIDHKAFDGRAAFDASLVDTLRAHEVDWVVLAGFMRVITPVLLDAFPYRIVNIHPALLPSFPGMHAQKQAFEYGVRIAGCTVHLVDAGTDTGPILAQAAVPVFDSDDASTLSARILAEEHQLLPRVLQWIVEGRVDVERPLGGGRARVRVNVDSREILAASNVVLRTRGTSQDEGGG